MRILMLTQFVYPPTIGGEERHVADLSQDLVARGHEVSIATFWQKGLPEFEIYRGVRIHRMRGTMQRISPLFSDSDRTYAPPFPDPGVMRALRCIIQEERPEIVHAHNWLVHSFTPLKAWSKAKFIMTLHDYGLVCVQKRLMRQGVNCSGPGIAKCLVCGTQFYGIGKGPVTTLANLPSAERERRAVDMFLPVSQAVAEGNRLDEHNVPYKVIPNFIPDQVDAIYDDDDPFLSKLPKGEYLLFVGDVKADKGVEVLLQAYAQINTRIPLVLIGRLCIEDLPQRLPPNVFLMGTCSHNAVMGAWQRSRLGLAPSTWEEPCPTVVMEAMVMGKPVIAARSGGLTDIVVDGETGLLVTPGDPQALRMAIQSLLDNPSLRERMGVLAKQRVVEFQAKSVVSRIEQVYQELLEGDSTSARSLASIRSRQKYDEAPV